MLLLFLPDVDKTADYESQQESKGDYRSTIEDHRLAEPIGSLAELVAQ
jgi:hypothetical protein